MWIVLNEGLNTDRFSRFPILPKVNAESIYEAIQELFDDLGGVTLELLIDNPKVSDKRVLLFDCEQQLSEIVVGN